METSNAFGAARDNKLAPLEVGAEDDAGGGLTRLGMSNCNFKRQERQSQRFENIDQNQVHLVSLQSLQSSSCESDEKLMRNLSSFSLIPQDQDHPWNKQCYVGAASENNPPALQDDAKNDAAGGLTHLGHKQLQFTRQGKTLSALQQRPAIRSTR